MAMQLPADTVEIIIPYQSAAAKYGMQVANIMSQIRSSRAYTAIDMQPHEFRWLIRYTMSPDPSDITDAEEFSEYLGKHSEVSLVARGGKAKWIEPLPVVPPQVKARFDERARLICGRQNRQNDTEDTRESDVSPVDHLNKWLEANPQADRRLAKVARFALEQLIGGS